MKRNKVIILTTLVLAIVYWLIDAAITSVNNNDLSYFESLFSFEDHSTLYMRFFVICIIIIISITVLLHLYYREKTKQKLHDLEMQYFDAFQQAAIGFAHLDLSGNILRMNEKFCSLFGYSKSQLENMNFREFAHPDDFERDQKLLRELINNNQSNAFIERRIKYADNTWGWVNLAISVVRNNKMDPEYFNIVINDITEHKRVLKSLKINEERYKNIFESNASCVAVYKPIDGGKDFLIIDFNPKAEEVEKVDKKKILGKKVTEVFPGIIEFGLLDTFRKVLKNQKPMNHPIKLYKDDRNSGYRENSVYPLSTGEVVSVFQDVTEKVKTEISLRESEERFRSLTELLPEAIFESDLHLNLNYVNQRALKLFGYSSEEFKQGINGKDMIAPEERERAMLNAKKRISENMFGPIEYTAIKKDGSRFPVLFHTNLVEKDGTYIGLRGVIIDITQRKQAERALKTAKEIQDAILSTTDVLLAYLDPDFNFITVNQAYANADGKSREFFIGKNHFDLYPSVENEGIFRKAVETGEKQVHIAKPFKYPEHQDRGISYWDWSISPMKDHNGKVQSLVLSLLDVTNRIQSDEQIRFLEEQFRQAQKMEAIGMLAGGIAHDFNNILNVILGYSELILSRMKPDDSNFSKITSIMKNAQRASNLTRQLLAFSRKQVLNTETLIINNIIKDMEKMLLRIIGENIDFSTNLQNDLNAVLGDRGQFEQIIMNLIVNAKDAMAVGGRLTIETTNVVVDENLINIHPDLKAGNYIILSVSDTGTGIPSKNIDKIFEPFFTTKDQSKGTGLGLSTVYGIVKQSKGSIYVKSELGIGTTFTIFLPAVANTYKDDKSKISDPKICTRELKILVVEDNKSMCEMIGEILDIEGYKTVLVSSPLKAIEVFKSQKDNIELLLTDVIMPELNGKKLADQLRKIKPELKILFMSGYTDGAIEEQGIINRTTNFIQKPFLSRELLKKIYKILEETNSDFEEIL